MQILNIKKDVVTYYDQMINKIDIVTEDALERYSDQEYFTSRYVEYRIDAIKFVEEVQKETLQNIADYSKNYPTTTESIEYNKIFKRFLLLSVFCYERKTYSNDVGSRMFFIFSICCLPFI